MRSSVRNAPSPSRTKLQLRSILSYFMFHTFASSLDLLSLKLSQYTSSEVNVGDKFVESLHDGRDILVLPLINSLHVTRKTGQMIHISIHCCSWLHKEGISRRKTYTMGSLHMFPRSKYDELSSEQTLYHLYCF